MIPVDDDREVKRIADLVVKYLEPHQPLDFRLEVVSKGMYRDDDWYYVVVIPSREDAHSYEYYGRLAEAEQELQENEKENILLVPALPNAG